MLNFPKVSRGVKQGSRRKPVTQFCVLSVKTCDKRKNVWIKCIDDHIFIYSSVQSG